MAEDPDLILIDAEMPVMSGTDVIRQLRRNPRFSKTPIIAVSAGVGRAERENLMDAGADAFLAKPLDLQELLSTIGVKLEVAVDPLRTFAGLGMATIGTPRATFEPGVNFALLPFLDGGAYR